MWLQLLQLDVLMAHATNRTDNDDIIIGGDFNAKALAWVSPLENKRGDIFLEALAATDITVANVGNTPTFLRNQPASILNH